jgi:hypothetical protein
MNKSSLKDLRNVFWLITIICYLFYFYKLNNFSSDYSSENKGFFAYGIGGFIGASIIPILLWGIYFSIKYDAKLRSKKINDGLNNQINEIDEILENEDFDQNFKMKFQSLDNLFEVKVLTKNEYFNKKLDLFNEYKKNKLLNDKILENQIKIDKLKEAQRLGVLSDAEYQLKLEALKDI